MSQISQSERGRDVHHSLLFECAWEVANKGKCRYGKGFPLVTYDD